MEEGQLFVEAFGADEKIGDYLRRAREVRGLDLAQLAKSIRLSTDVVQAIEDSRWGYFQVEAYLRCYLVSICEKLQIDKTDVLKKLSLEINSTFKKTEPVSIIRQEAAASKNKEQKPPSKFPTVEIVVVLVVITILFFVAKTMNSEAEEDEIEELEDAIETELEPQNEASETEAEPAPETAGQPAATASVNENATDTLRFECTPSGTDPTCGIKLNGIDKKMIFFKRPETRYVNRSADTVHITITVPERTKILLNNEKQDYGKFNTLLFYKGEFARKFNREIR